MLPVEDHFWEAYRFHTGEMSAADAEAYVSRLPDDLAACEALAEAMRLTEALRISTPAAVRSRKSMPALRSRQVMLRWVVGGVLSLLVIGTVGVGPLRRFWDDDTAQSLVGTLYVGMSDESSASGDLDEGRAGADAELVMNDTVHTATSETEMDVPDWLMIALADEPSELTKPPNPDEI